MSIQIHKIGVFRAEPSDLSADLCIKKKHFRGYIHNYVNPAEFKKPTYSDALASFVENQIKKSKIGSIKKNKNSIC